MHAILRGAIALSASVREHPGRIGNAIPQGGNCQSTSGSFEGRTLRAGDPELKLRVEGLNGYAAMMATMKEMGYESEGDEDGNEIPDVAKLSGTTGPDVEKGLAIAPASTCGDYGTGTKVGTNVQGVASTVETVACDDGPASAMFAGRRRTRLVVVAIVTIILGLMGAATSTIIFASREGGSGRSMLELDIASDVSQIIVDWCRIGARVMDIFRTRIPQCCVRQRQKLS